MGEGGPAGDHERMRSWLEDAVGAPLRAQLAAGMPACGRPGAARRQRRPMRRDRPRPHHRRVFDPPTPLQTARGQVATLRGHPGVITLAPGPQHWAIVDQLCRAGGATGNLVADAAHAAVAVEHGATWVSKDRDFARFAGLRWRRPLER